MNKVRIFEFSDSRPIEGIYKLNRPHMETIIVGFLREYPDAKITAATCQVIKDSLFVFVFYTEDKKG